MKKIGLIGGMSWESTVSYYQVINQVVKEKLGGLNSAECILYSVNFEEIELLQSQNQWEKAGILLAHAASSLESAGADFIVICTNTMHKVSAQIQSNISIPVLHIADCTAQKLLDNNITKIALLGTKYTMEQDFISSKIQQHNIQVMVPPQEQRTELNRIIFEELCLGNLILNSKKYFLNTIQTLSQQGAQGVILGCTEIGLLIQQSDTSIPLFDTAFIHAQAAAIKSLE